ncbi:hypothetical protein [Streptosporangium sp. G12]
MLARLLAEQDRLDELRALAEADPDTAGYRLAELLADRSTFAQPVTLWLCHRRAGEVRGHGGRR